ncbi:MAG: hypothetical protein JRJ68_01290 [Deltaproteobacteria bacterium]|nr:hypothetical protein [Deltaproteobacteria bacterium]
MQMIWNRRILRASLFFLILWVGCAGPVLGGTGDRVVRTTPADLQPGLSVVYIEKKYRNINQIPTGAAALRAGYQGKPVMILNHQSDKNGVVFDSGRSQGVAMVMDGFVHLEKAGIYLWRALANDGIRMFIDDRMIFEDPLVHKDKLTPVGSFQAGEAGWYPLNIIYFQRKGTSALKLYWQSPGAEEFGPVSAEAYWHLQTD